MVDIGKMFGVQSVKTFMGVPEASIEALKGEIAVLGVPAATPYPWVGAYASEGPHAIRQGVANYAANLTHHDFDLGGPIMPEKGRKLVDCGDLAWDERDHAANRDRIRTAVGGILKAGSTPILLGGDDSIPIPMLEAYAGHGPITILQLDAHPDWRDDVRGERWGLSSTMRRASEMKHVERIVQVGQRAIGSARPSDYQDALKAGVKFVMARDVHARGIGQVVDLVPKGSKVCIVFDLDVLDPAIMPAVIGAAPGGLSFWQALEIIHQVAEKATLAGCAVVEFLAAKDRDGLGGLTAGRLVCNVAGLMARQ